MLEFSYDTPHITLRTILIVVGILGGGILLVAYLAFQARFLLQGPVITLTNEPGVIQHERVVTLTGTVKNITRLTLNGRQIFTDERGYFNEALVLENGYTIATLAATDRYGRKTTVTRPFVFTSLPTPDAS